MTNHAVFVRVGNGASFKLFHAVQRLLHNRFQGCEKSSGKFIRLISSQSPISGQWQILF